jgi:(p)ppGpp synthase/HD superfamily hydrolase
MAADKKIKLNWKQHEHIEQLEVEMKDRTGIFADILSTLTSNNVKVLSVNAKGAKSSLRMMLHVSGSEEQLNKTLPMLKQVRDVIGVKTA